MKRKFVAICCAIAMASALMPVSVMATENTTTEAAPAAETTTEVAPSTTEGAPATTETTTTEESKPATIGDIFTTDDMANNTNKPYISLGADLSAEQKATVLSIMGITEADLANYTVSYVTNAEEHAALDSYIDSSVIGSKSLSSVMVKETESGTGIRVTTVNINYCTVDMYRNALLTSGVENADILVAGPFPISGTAALLGAWNAYEAMHGKKLDEDAKEAALNEIVVTGELNDSVSAEDKEKLQDLLDYVKAEVVANGLTDPDKIKEVVQEGIEKYDIELTEDQIKSLTDLYGQIGELDIDPVKLLEQAGDMYDKYGETVLADAKEMFETVVTDEVKESLGDAFSTMFQNVWNAVVSFFKGGNK
jgi:uncharacterized protein YpuA (DUF1002 family)